MSKQMKDSQGENHVLQGEVTDLRFKLMMVGSEAAGVPEDTVQEWQAQKEHMQSQLQAAQEKYLEILKREKSAQQTGSSEAGMAIDMVKLRDVETELEGSKSQVSRLTERCEDLQKQLKSLQAGAPGLTAGVDASSGLIEQSAFMGRSDVPPEGAEGWGDADASWGAWDDEQPGEHPPTAPSDKQPGLADGVHGKSAAAGVEADASVVTALRGLLEQGKESGVEPAAVSDVIALLSEYGVTSGSMHNNSSATTQGVVPLKTTVTNNEGLAAHGEGEGEVLGGSAANQLSVSLSPVNTHVSSICSDAVQDAKGTAAESYVSPGTSELFDSAAVAVGTSCAPLPPKLQLPLVAWESFAPAELSRYLQVLSAVSSAVSGQDVKPSSLSLQAHRMTGDHAAESANKAALQARVQAAEHALVSACSEVAQAQLHMTRSSQRSTIRTMSGTNSGLPMLRRLSGDTAAAPDTPVSDTGSPGLPSMMTLNKILQDLLKEHQALLQCAESSSVNAPEHRTTLKKLAAAAEAELHRLQALQSQQQDEVSIQWNEKQQLQSAAQTEITTARQVCLRSAQCGAAAASELAVLCLPHCTATSTRAPLQLSLYRVSIVGPVFEGDPGSFCTTGRNQLSVQAMSGGVCPAGIVFQAETGLFIAAPFHSGCTCKRRSFLWLKQSHALQELAVTQQENEMLRAQLEELESAHEQVTSERDVLHQQTQELHHQVEHHTHILSSPAALQDLVTVQMMPHMMDLGSDSTLTPTSNNQSTPTPHDTSAQGLVAETSGGTVGAGALTEDLSESPEPLGSGGLQARPDVPPLLSLSLIHI